MDINRSFIGSPKFIRKSWQTPSPGSGPWIETDDLKAFDAIYAPKLRMFRQICLRSVGFTRVTNKWASYFPKNPWWVITVFTELYLLENRNPKGSSRKDENRVLNTMKKIHKLMGTLSESDRTALLIPCLNETGGQDAREAKTEIVDGFYKLERGLPELIECMKYGLLQKGAGKGKKKNEASDYFLAAIGIVAEELGISYRNLAKDLRQALYFKLPHPPRVEDITKRIKVAVEERGFLVGMNPGYMPREKAERYRSLLAAPPN